MLDSLLQELRAKRNAIRHELVSLFIAKMDFQIAQHKKILTRIQQANKTDSEQLLILDDVCLSSPESTAVMQALSNRDKNKKILVVDHVSLIDPHSKFTDVDRIALSDRQHKTMIIQAREEYAYPVEPMTGQEKRRQRRKSKKK